VEPSCLYCQVADSGTTWLENSGRGEWIRTTDLLVPNQALNPLVERSKQADRVATNTSEPLSRRFSGNCSSVPEDCWQIYK
jgi:hypothetical protein